MKQVLTSIAGTAVGTLIFLVLLLAGSIAYSSYTEMKRSKAPDTGWTKKPAGLKISRHSKVEGVDNFTVSGVIENFGAVEWCAPRIIVKVSASEKSISECETTVYGRVPPGSKHSFQVACGETSSELPYPTSYEIEVSQAGSCDG